MGFFSWNCLGCGLSIRAAIGGDDHKHWLCQAVVIRQNGDRVSGAYNGYGSVGGMEVTDWDDKAAFWHKACYERAGKPEFSRPSPPADDQGWFCGIKSEWPTSPDAIVRRTS